MKMKLQLKFLSVFLAITVLFSSMIFVGSAKAATYNQFKWINTKQIEVTAYRLNVRTGPGTSFPVIGSVKRGQVLDVMGALESWLVVHLPDNSVGVISSTYTRVVSYHNPPEPTPQPKEPAQPSNPSTKYGDLSAQEKQMFDLVNADRKKNGLSELTIDYEVSRVARIKAQDMADNDYFSHTSPTYGSPFEMLKKFGVSYSAAGENIAGNNTVQNAETAFMNSPGHRANILSSRYTAVGIGIVNDDRYGLIFVQMFVNR